MRMQLLGSQAELGKREWKRRLSLARKHLREQNARYGTELTEMPRTDWPNSALTERTPDRVWRSKNYLVQGFEGGRQDEVLIRLSICRAEVDDDGEWKADIPWEELQRIKDECGFEYLDAVEVYPNERDVVNVANMRHLWVLKTRLPFAWRTIGG